MEEGISHRKMVSSSSAPSPSVTLNGNGGFGRKIREEEWPDSSGNRNLESKSWKPSVIAVIRRDFGRGPLKRVRGENGGEMDADRAGETEAKG